MVYRRQFICKNTLISIFEISPIDTTVQAVKKKLLQQLSLILLLSRSHSHTLSPFAFDFLICQISNWVARKTNFAICEFLFLFCFTRSRKRNKTQSCNCVSACVCVSRVCACVCE